MKKVIFGIITALLISGCSGNLPNNQISSKIKIITTIYPYKEMAQAIGGDKVEVQSLLQPGMEPHDFEPSPQDMVKVMSSNILIVNGAGMEPWVTKISGDLQKNKIQVVDQSKVIQSELLNGEGHNYDPHFWLDPEIYNELSKNLSNQLSEISPENQSYFVQNYQSFNKKIENLNSDFKNAFANNNCAQNTIVTNHAAFNYFAKRYNLKALNIHSLSPEIEPTAKDLVELKNEIGNLKVKYLFTEELVSPKTAETLANEAQIKTMTLNPLENLTDEQIQAEENYFTIMEKNLENLKIALECKS